MGLKIAGPTRRQQGEVRPPGWDLGPWTTMAPDRADAVRNHRRSRHARRRPSRGEAMAIAPEILEQYPNLPGESTPAGPASTGPGWPGTAASGGSRPKPGPRGLTMMDIAVGSYGEVPEHPGTGPWPPRGADIAEDTPDMGYILNRKSDVWAANVRRALRGGGGPPVVGHPRHPVGRPHRAALRPGARHLPAVHHPVRDRDDRLRPAGQVDVADEPRVPRSQDVPLHPDHGRGPPLRGVPQAGPGQRRRPAHDPGPAPRPCSARSSRPRPTPRPPPCSTCWARASSSTCSARARPSPATEVEKKIFRMTMQDEARHVAYGTLHIRHAVEADPDVAEEVHEALDHGEKAMVALGRAPDMSTAIALLLAGGADRVEDVGFPLQQRSEPQPVHLLPGPLRAGRREPPGPHDAPPRRARHRLDQIKAGSL